MNAFPLPGNEAKKLGANFAPLSVITTSTPSMNVVVQPGTFFTSSGTLIQAGGTSPAIAKPPMHAWWVVVGVNAAGGIQLVYGAASAFPAVPQITPDVLPLAAVYVTYATTAIFDSNIQDIRPFVTMDRVADTTDYATTAQLDSVAASKADLDGTTSSSFTINKNGSGDTYLFAGAGAIRYVQLADRWEFSNDGVTFTPFVSDTGSFAPIIHTHAIQDVIGLEDALNEKLDAASSSITASGNGNLPISLVSIDSGSAGLRVERSGPAAKIEWDESMGAWFAGVAGNMEQISVPIAGYVESVNGQSGVVSLSASDVGAAAEIHSHTASDVTDFNTAAINAVQSGMDYVESVNGQMGPVTITAFDIGAAEAAHTHATSDITDFTSGVTAVVATIPTVRSINGFDGDVVLTAGGVGAAPSVHQHVSADVTDLSTVVAGIISSSTISPAQVSGLAAIATSGSFADLIDVPTTANTVFVAANGNDATADGSISRPFATVQAAHDFAVGAYGSSVYIVIYAMPGTYSGVTFTRPRTWVSGITGQNFSTNLRYLHVDSNTSVGGVPNTSFGASNLSISNNTNSDCVSATGAVPMTLSLENVRVFVATSGARGVTTDVGGSTSTVRLFNVDINTKAANGAGIYMRNANGFATNVAVDSGGANAVDLEGGYLVANGVGLEATHAQVGRIGANGILISGFGLVVRNYANNADGIVLESNGAMSYATATFTIPGTTGFAVRGTLGTGLAYGVTMFTSPDGTTPVTNRISSAVTQVPTAGSFTAV